VGSIGCAFSCPWRCGRKHITTARWRNARQIVGGKYRRRPDSTTPDRRAFSLACHGAAFGSLTRGPRRRIRGSGTYVNRLGQNRPLAKLKHAAAVRSTCLKRGYFHKESNPHNASLQNGAKFLSTIYVSNDELMGARHSANADDTRALSSMDHPRRRQADIIKRCRLPFLIVNNFPSMIRPQFGLR
jgi:hypothetical protein